jgi:hypothetical protein
VFAAGGTVWVSRAVPQDTPASTGAETLGFDAASGAIVPVDPTVAPLAVAASGRGVWGVVGQGPPSGSSTFGMYYGLPLALVDREGSTVLRDAFPGRYWDSTTLEPDAGGLWLAGARRVPRPGGVVDGALVRITNRGRITTLAKAHPWSVATDDHGSTWFLGTTHRVVTNVTPQPLDWVIGRVDTLTGAHLRTYHVDLPPGLGTVTSAGPALQLLAATGGALWLSAGTSSGNALVRVTMPTN